MNVRSLYVICAVSSFLLFSKAVVGKDIDLCASPISKTDLIEIAVKAAQDNGGKADDIRKDFEFIVGEDECNYSVIASMPEHVGGFFVKINRNRVVLSFSWMG